jgi:hypothetical protein
MNLSLTMGDYEGPDISQDKPPTRKSKGIDPADQGNKNPNNEKGDATARREALEMYKTMNKSRTEEKTSSKELQDPDNSRNVTPVPDTPRSGTSEKARRSRAKEKPVPEVCPVTPVIQSLKCDYLEKVFKDNTTNDKRNKRHSPSRDSDLSEHTFASGKLHITETT